MGPELFGVGFGEALLVLVVALIVVGPKRFPEIARQGGRWYRVARRYTANVTADMREALQELEHEVDPEHSGGLRSLREVGEAFERELVSPRTEAPLRPVGEPAVEASRDPRGSARQAQPGSGETGETARALHAPRELQSPRPLDGGPGAAPGS